MLDIIIYGIIILAIIIGIFLDLKTKEVPDTLNYGLIFLGLLTSIIISLTTKNIFPFLSSLLGFSVGFFIGTGMYYLRQWGGGDAKLLIGISTMIGLTIPFTTFPKLLFYIILVFVAGFFYTLIYMIVILIKKRNEVMKLYNNIPTTIKWIKDVFLVISIAIFLAYLLLRNINLLILFLISGGIYIITYIYLLSYFTHEISMKKIVKPNKLTIGDWLFEDIKVGNKVIISKNTKGLEEEDIELIKKLYKQKKIKNVIVKEGIPFTPSFLIGIILLILLELLKII